MKFTLPFLVTLTLALVYAQGQVDVTLIPGNSGSGVVEAVVNTLRNSCSFPNDYHFLRRLAFAASQDGNNPDTYRPGFDGGIWQINQTLFRETQTSAMLVDAWPKIRATFNIDWSRVQYSDLRKPLYSGIAAMLTLIRLSNGKIPREDERQAAFYQNKVLPQTPNSAYNFLQLIKTLDQECTTNVLDIAFLVDSSTTVSPNSFELAKQFASKVVGDFTISPNDVRVAFVTFSSGYKPHFDFQRYTTKADVQAALMAVQKVEGVTDTDQALRYASDTLFTAVSGSRPSATRVAVIITDGRSGNNLEAVKNAQALKDRGIILFVIGAGDDINSKELNSLASSPTCTHVASWPNGVGDDIDSTELNSLASSPTCTHVQEVTDYAELNSLISEVRAVSCSVPGLDFGMYTFPCTQQQTYRIDTKGVTSVVITPRSGFVSVYGSYSLASVSSGNPDVVTLATSTRPAVIYMSDKDLPLYLSVRTDLTQTGQCNTDYDVQIVPSNAVRRDTNNICITNGVVRTCTVLDILMALYQVSKPNNLGFQNPCDPNRPGYFVYPYNAYRFVYCDRSGNAYVVDCPIGSYYDDIYKDCIKGSPPTTPPPTTPTTTPTPTTTSTTITTPRPRPASTLLPITGSTGGFVLSYFPECNGAEYQAGVRFFGYSANETKYIQCSEYPGLGVLKDCQAFHKWNQDYQSCVYKDIVIDWTKNIYQSTPRPLDYLCKSGEASIFFHAHPYEPTKYIQCDEFGDAFVKDCPKNEIWSQLWTTCVPGIAARNIVG